MSLKPIKVQIYHVFLASPGGVNTERQHVRRFFDRHRIRVVAIAAPMMSFVISSWSIIQGFLTADFADDADEGKGIFCVHFLSALSAVKSFPGNAFCRIDCRRRVARWRFVVNTPSNSSTTLNRRSTSATTSPAKIRCL